MTTSKLAMKHRNRSSRSGLPCSRFSWDQICPSQVYIQPFHNPFFLPHLWPIFSVDGGGREWGKEDKYWELGSEGSQLLNKPTATAPQSTSSCCSTRTHSLHADIKGLTALRKINKICRKINAIQLVENKIMLHMFDKLPNLLSFFYSIF